MLALTGCQRVGLINSRLLLRWDADSSFVHLLLLFIDNSVNITYLYQYFVSPDMAGGTRTYEMAHRLVKAGHEVNIISSYRDRDCGRDWFLTQEAGITVHWYPVPYSNTMGFRARIGAFVKFAIAAARRAATLDADVVFASSTPLTIALPGAYAAWRRKCPMVFEVRDLWPEMPIAVGAIRNPLAVSAARMLERFAYRRSSRVIALSPGMADGVAATGYPPHRISVIPNGCDLVRFDPQTTNPQRFRGVHPELGQNPIVLYAGVLGKVNGVGYLAELAAAMRQCNPSVRFVILAQGAEEEIIRTRAQELGVLNTNFFMYQRVPKKQVADAFAAASMITSVFIELREMENNSANKFFDGLASGTPVAINYGGWQADLLRESGCGLVLSRNLQRAAEDLTAWLGDSERLSRAGKAARGLAERQFSRDALAGQLEAVLREVVVEDPRRAAHSDSIDTARGSR